MRRKDSLQEATVKKLLDNEMTNLNESKKLEAVTPDKEYQGIKYFDNKDGWCPVCNTQLHYEPVEYAGEDVVLYPWHCTCGASGEAYFKQQFIGHSVYDEDYDLIDLPFDDAKTEGKKEELFNSNIDLNVNAGDVSSGNNLDLGGLGEIASVAGLFASEENLKEVKKKAEGKLNFLPVSELPTMCYGLLPSDNSIIVIMKFEKGYYKTDYDIPESYEEAEKLVTKLNSEIDVTPDQRFTMELRSMSGNWSDKKTEDFDFDKINDYYKKATTDLEKAFTTEVKYWLQTLIDEKSNDEIGKRAERVLSDDGIVAEIVDELVNGSDELWEEIHMRIESLAGIDYRNSTR